MSGPLAEDRARLESVVAEAFARLEAGRSVYGSFDAAADPRDLRLEAEEELLDAIVYAYLAILKLRAARKGTEVSPLSPVPLSLERRTKAGRWDEEWRP